MSITCTHLEANNILWSKSWMFIWNSAHTHTHTKHSFSNKFKSKKILMPTISSDTLKFRGGAPVEKPSFLGDSGNKFGKCGLCQNLWCSNLFVCLLSFNDGLACDFPELDKKKSNEIKQLNRLFNWFYINANEYNGAVFSSMGFWTNIWWTKILSTHVYNMYCISMRAMIFDVKW